MSFEGKIALVTGASRGIGRAIAETLVARGARVIGTATSDKGAEDISAYLGENGKGLNLNVVDPKSGKPTRIGRKLDEKGALVRYSKKSGEEIK